jgi:hypothetical protein
MCLYLLIMHVSVCVCMCLYLLIMYVSVCVYLLYLNFESERETD